MQHVPSRPPDDNGHFISEWEQTPQRWVEYSSQLLNRPPSKELKIISPVQQRKYNKSLGEDGIPPEIVKSCFLAMVGPLSELFRHILNTEALPRNWAASTLFTVSNKRRQDHRSKFQGYQSVQLFATVLLNSFCC